MVLFTQIIDQICLDQIPFMLSSSADLFNPIMFMPSGTEDSEERLDKLHMAQKIPTDGNCLFYSVAYSIKCNWKLKRKF